MGTDTKASQDRYCTNRTSDEYRLPSQRGLVQVQLSWEVARSNSSAAPRAQGSSESTYVCFAESPCQERCHCHALELTGADSCRLRFIWSYSCRFGSSLVGSIRSIRSVVFLKRLGAHAIVLRCGASLRMMFFFIVACKRYCLYIALRMFSSLLA